MNRTAYRVLLGKIWENLKIQSSDDEIRLWKVRNECFEKCRLRCKDRCRYVWKFNQKIPAFFRDTPSRRAHGTNGERFGTSDPVQASCKFGWCSCLNCVSYWQSRISGKRADPKQSKYGVFSFSMYSKDKYQNSAAWLLVQELFDTSARIQP